MEIELLKKKDTERNEVLENLRTAVAPGHSEKSDLQAENEKLCSQLAEKTNINEELEGRVRDQSSRLNDLASTVKARGCSIHAVYSDILSKLGARTFGYVITDDPMRFFLLA